MIASKPLRQPNSGAAQAAQSANHAINEAPDSLGDTAQEMRHQAAPLPNRATEQASALAERGVNAVSESSQQLRDKALRASDRTVNYIKNEPIKAMLIAAATGAVLMTMVSLMSRSRARG